MGLTPIRPAYRLTANDQDVTAAIAERFKSLRLVDEAGLQADTLEVALADNDPANPIKLPKTGAELELWLGYDDQVTRMGLFVCDEVEFSGWPGTMTIRARAAVYNGTPKGKVNLQTQKSRSWKDGTKLGAMVAKIATEHGMEAAVAKSLASITLPHFDQTEESDVSFLLRVLKHYDAIVKPAGGKLMVIKRGESKTISGEDLPTVTVAAKDVSDWHMTISRRETPGTVVAYYRDLGARRKVEVSVGAGDPVMRIRHHHPNKDAALAAARAELDKRTRRQHSIILGMPGDVRLSAETLLQLTGFRVHVDGAWLVKRVIHELTDGGYRCSVEAERPADDEAESSAAPAAAAKPAVAPAPATVAATSPTRDKATVQAEFDQLKATWLGEQKKALAVLGESYDLRDAGQVVEAKAKFDESKAMMDATNAKHSPKYDQLKAELAALA